MFSAKRFHVYQLPQPVWGWGVHYERLLIHFLAPFCVLNVLLLVNVIAVYEPSLFLKIPLLNVSLLPRFNSVFFIFFSFLII